jgi:hypothetical protein
MNSSSFLRTDNGGCYLYDTNQQQLLNVHPIIETIRHFDDNEKAKDIAQCLVEKYPELTDNDIERHLKKI